MNIIQPEAKAYAEKFTSAHDFTAEQVFDQTVAAHPHAHLMSSRAQGMFLKMISHMLKPRRVLEIGTFTGFSALCLSTGLAADGILHTIETRKQDAQTAAHFFSQSAQAGRIRLHIGDATGIIPELVEDWDLIFLDADKTGYINYYELTLPRLKPGGFLIADNVLFHGEVLEKNISGKNAKAIVAFNEHTAKDIRTEQVMLTIRDGLSIFRKL